MSQVSHQTPHQTLHQQLLQLRSQAKAWLEGRASGRFYPFGGICDGLVLGEADYDFLRDRMEAWPAGTGRGRFPVPHPAMPPRQAYMEATEREMWNPEFEYARNRWALLEWLIEQTAPTIQLGEKA